MQESKIFFGEMWSFYHEAERRPRLIGGMGLDVGEQIHIYDLLDRMGEGDNGAHLELLNKYVELAAQARISFSGIYPTNPLYDPEVEMPPRLRKKAMCAFGQMNELLQHKGYVFVMESRLDGGCRLERIPVEE